MVNKLYKKFRPGFFTLVFFTIGLVFLLVLIDETPSKDGLLSVEGIPYSVEKGRTWSGHYDPDSTFTRFRLNTEENFDFLYDTISGKGEEVYEGILSASKLSATVSLEYNPNDLRTGNRDRPAYSIMSIQIKSKVLRSYNDVAQAWNSNYKLGYSFGIFLIFISVTIYLRGLLFKRASETP